MNAGEYSIHVSNTAGVGKMYKGEVYTGTCPSLTLVTTDSLFADTDTEFNISFNNTVNATVFYVKLYNKGGSVSFNKTMASHMNIFGNPGYCPGDQVILKAKVFNMNGTPGYTWQPGGATTSSITIASPVGTTNYTLTYQDGGGTLTFTINVFPLGPNVCKNCEQVKNGHFETFDNVSIQGHLLYDVPFWNVGLGGGAYYCSAFFGNVPSGQFAVNTPAYSGSAYAGFLAFDNSSSDFRTYLKSDLKCPLVQGQNYQVSFYTMSGNKSHYATNHIGAYLSVALIPTTSTVLNYTPNIENGSSVINASTSWTQISGTVTGNNEQYINIGNFYTTANTTTAVSTSTNAITSYSALAYYIVDDVSITPLTPTLTASTNSVNCNTASTITLTATGSSSVYTTWTNGVTTYSGSVVSVPTPTTTTTYTCNVNLPCSSCSVLTQTITITTIPAGVAITNTTTTICAGLATFTAVPTPTNVTYSWQVWNSTNTSTLSASMSGSTTATPTINFAGIYQNVNVCATVTNTNGCSASNCVSLLSCCSTPTNTTKYTNTTFTTSTTLTGTTTAKYQFSGTVTVNSGVSLTILTADVTMDPMTIFLVKSGGYLQISESYVHGCNAMWNGIFALNTATVLIGDSRIEDGIRTLLDSTGDAKFYITGNEFNKNYIAITGKAAKSSTSSFTIIKNIFSSSTWTVPTGVPYVTTVPSYTVAPLLYSYSVANLLPPYQTLKGYEGIQLVEVTQAGATNSMVPIGDATSGSENIFDKLQIGIHCVRSNILAQNNVFQNIKNSTNPGTYNAGIFVYSIQSGHAYSLYPSCNVQVGGSTTSQKNTFIDNDNGVYSWQRNTLNIANNTFSTQTTGIYMQENFLGLTVDITKNKFSANLKGLLFTDNSNVIANITENRFENTAATVGSYSTNVGITLSVPTVPTGTPTDYGKYTVYNNYINNYYNGIKTINTYSTQITDNEVHMAQDATAGNFQMGITAEGSRYTNTTSNTIDMTSLNGSWWQYGIYYAYAQAPFINCNVIDKVGTSIKIQGTCNTLTNGNELLKNQMSNAWTGIWLDAGDFNASQAYWVGATPYAGDNTWTGTMTQRTYASNHSNLSNSLLYTQSGATYKVVNGIDAFDDAVPFVNSLVGNNSSTTNGSNSCATQTSTPSFKMGQGSNARLFASAQQIAKGTLNVAGTDNAVNLNYLNQKYLMENILLEGADISNDTVLTNFMTAIRPTNIGKFSVIDSLFQTATIEDDSSHATCNLAAAQNNAIQPQNTIEHNQKIFNGIYVDYLKHTISQEQIQSLRELAIKCPETDGHSVFQARAVLSGIDKNIYYSDCENNKGNERMRNMDEQNPIDISNFKVYPNPSAKEINTLLNLDEGKQAKILIYNLLGELVKQNNLQNGITKIDVSDLNSGTYLYQVIIDNEKAKHGKLIIIK